MKKIIATFILFSSTIVNAQELSKWQVGINLNPFFFTRISPDFYPEKKDNHYPNGFGAGITIEKNWNDHWGVKTGLEWTTQVEKYDLNENSADNPHLTSRFEYYKTPVTIQYSYPLKEKLFLTFNQGVQFSFLKYYKTVNKGELQSTSWTSNDGEYIFYGHPERYSYHSGKGTIYKKNLLGIIGSLGLKGFLSNKISYSTNLRYEYDITDADNHPMFKKYDWRPTHNLRIGLELGLQYHFSLSGCGFCDNQKH